MIQIWGRANSVNVHKVLWCCGELGLDFERIDAGMQFGRTQDADYLALNPNGRVPTLVDGGFVLWESNAIVRYLVLRYGVDDALYPSAPAVRASVERWLDWVLSTLQFVERPVFQALVRTAAAARDASRIAADARALAPLWQIVDAHLSGREFVEGGRFTIADLVLGCYARRWFGFTGIEQPPTPHLTAWYGRLERRPPFQRYLAQPMT